MKRPCMGLLQEATALAASRRRRVHNERNSTVRRLSRNSYMCALDIANRAGQCDVTVLRDALATSELVLHKRSVL